MPRSQTLEEQQSAGLTTRDEESSAPTEYDPAEDRDHEQESEFYQRYLDREDRRLRIPNLDELKENLKRYPERLRRYPRKLLSLLKGEQVEPLLIHTGHALKCCGRSRHQILRSASAWSIGLPEQGTEQSIHEAYLSAIERAKHFIYIENQFFISKKNKVADRLVERVLRAAQAQQKFRVLVLLPLLPGFEGNVVDPSSGVLRIQLHWEYQTICRGVHSLLQRLRGLPRPRDYIQFLSLRNHGLTSKAVPVTEMVYIHSKLMIVDDSTVILGSANINDRSLLGDRDSELAVVIEDQDVVPTKYGYAVSKSAHELRLNLFREHFALDRAKAEDFLSEEMWESLRSSAQAHTILYREIFGCYPDDHMTSFLELVQLQSLRQPAKYHELRPMIRSHVVEFPLHFLAKEDLRLTPSQREFYVPEINFL